MGLIMEDKDFLYGLELLICQKEEFFNGLEKQKYFYRLFIRFLRRDVEFISKERDERYREECNRFFGLSLVILGSLFSANGRKFPNITWETIDKKLDEFGKEPASGPESYSEIQRLHEKTLHEHERVQNLNPLLKDCLINYPISALPHSFGVYCIYQLANIFLEQAEKEAESIKNGEV